jgi:hypothetical protein
MKKMSEHYLKEATHHTATCTCGAKVFTYRPVGSEALLRKVHMMDG